MAKKSKIQGYIKEGFFVLLAIVSIIYLSNPTAGIIELIPDNIPIFGNLDEGMATVYLMSAIQRYFRFNPVTEANRLLGA